MEVTTECVVKIKAARVNRCLKAKIFFFKSVSCFKLATHFTKRVAGINKD